ncbi:MAG: ABC transporter permease [Sedimentisphaerales bacterium]|jgi:peptide/nickel transport system permease protein|nr:ABC transporter permease [Sedimentisphaerales bacterium]
MTTYIIRRILLMIPTLLGITVMVFAISRIAPGDPVSLSIGAGGELDAERAADVRKARMELYGLDKPVHVQYGKWLWRVVRLDFGDSIKHHRPVIELIGERLPITLALNLIAFFLIYTISIPLGVLAAVRHNRFFDRASSVVLFMLWSLPVMWVGQMLIGYFCGPTFKQWFPPAGLSNNYADSLAFFPWLADRSWHLVLPVFCLTYSGLAYLTKQVRAGMLDNLRADYVRTARAKGLSNATVVFRHAFRNSVIPVITIMATLLPAMLGGSVIIERIFSIPGMGLLAFEAVTTRDYNVVMAVATIGGVMNLVGLLFGDIAYAIADPRISFESSV